MFLCVRLIRYCPVWGGYNWFTGPQPNITVGFVDNTGNTPTGAVPDNLLLHDETVGRLEFAAKSEARLRRRPTDDKLTTLSRHMSMAAMQQLMSVSQRTQSVACTELEDNNGWVGRGSVPRGDVERGSAMLELLRHADVSTGQNVEAAAWRMERPKHLSFTAVNTKHKVRLQRCMHHRRCFSSVRTEHACLASIYKWAFMSAAESCTSRQA